MDHPGGPGSFKDGAGSRVVELTRGSVEARTGTGGAKAPRNVLETTLYGRRESVTWGTGRRPVKAARGTAVDMPPAVQTPMIARRGPGPAMWSSVEPRYLIPDMPYG